MIEELVDRAWSCLHRLSTGGASPENGAAELPSKYASSAAVVDVDAKTGRRLFIPPPLFATDQSQKPPFVIGCEKEFTRESRENRNGGAFLSASTGGDFRTGARSDSRLEQAFQLLLDELDLSPEKQRQLLEQPDEKKWLMISGSRKASAEQGDCCESTIRRLEEFVRNYPDRYTLPLGIQNLEALAVSLRTESFSFVNSFVNTNGIHLLGKLLNASHLYGPGAEHLAIPILGCFRALLNSSVLALEILSGLCLAQEEGHGAVLKALTDVRPLLCERTRFQKLIDDLHRDYGQPKDTDRVRIAQSLEFRLHLRHELLMLGIQEVISRLRNPKCSANLEDHLDLFMMMRQEDEQELASLSDSRSSSPTDFESPMDMAEVLHARLENTLAQPHFASLLHHLLMLPADEQHLHLWRLFDLLLQQITLNTPFENFANADPQFSAAPLRLPDMNELLGRLRTEHDCECLEKRVNELSTELDTERRRVVELENRLSDLQDGVSLVSTYSRVSETSSSPSDPCHSPTFPTFTPGSTNTLPPIRPPTGLPPPPPPPSVAQLRSGTLPSAVQAPLKKGVPKPPFPLRTLNWTVVPYNKIAGTVWEKIDDEKLYKHINTEQLSEEFAAPSKENGGETGTLSRYNTAGRRNLRMDNLISVIDSRRAQNCTIMLSRLKLSHREIRNAVLSMDERGRLPKDMIEQMLKFVPTREELNLLRDTVTKHRSPVALALADRFLYEVGQIPRYKQRLMCLHTIRTFNERIDEVKPNLQAIIKASTAISTSGKLKQFLAIVLAIGNILNHGKRNGNAYGFTSNSLDYVQSVRSSVKADRNLMHFIVELAEKKFPELLRIKWEISAAYEASRINGADLDAEIRSMDSAIHEVSTELKRLMKESKEANDTNISTAPPDEPMACGTKSFSPEFEKQDAFVRVVTSFLETARREITEVQSLQKDMNIAYSNCTKLFAEDVRSTKKPSPDEFFCAFVKCVNAFTDCYKAMWEERGEIERNKRQTLVRQMFAVRKKDSKQKMQAAANKATADKNFDLIVNALQTGELFSGELSRLRTSIRVPHGDFPTAIQPLAIPRQKRRSSKGSSKRKSSNSVLITGDGATIIESF